MLTMLDSGNDSENSDNDDDTISIVAGLATAGVKYIKYENSNIFQHSSAYYSFIFLSL